MEKIKKIALILLIWLVTMFFISVIQIRPISVSLIDASFSQIPIIYWIALLISPIFLYLIARNSKNPLVPLLCVVVYFFFFFFFCLYFLSHPTFSDISSSARYQEVLSSITHIDPREFDSERFISTARYFKWPIFFIFSKVFTSILGIGPIQTLNLGFFSLMLVLPFVLSLFYKRTKTAKNATVYFILPAFYLTLSWHFINDQFVPQFLGLIYLLILFGCYRKYMERKNPLFLLLMIIFYALTVFTHAFMCIFFLVAIIFEFFWSEYIEMKRGKFITYGMVIIFFAMLFPYLDVYYSLATATSGGESWKIFQSILSQGGVGGGGHPVQLLYHLIPKLYTEITSSFTKVAMALAFSSVAIAFILHIFKKRQSFDFKKGELFDISILIGSAAWFVLGLAKLVLGQRALQVTALPLARYFNYPHKLFSYTSKIVVVVILISPSIFIANDLINSSVRGDRLVHDFDENLAGRFMDIHLTNASIILTAQNPYPTGYPSGFREFMGTFEELKMVDIVLASPKLRKIFLYNQVAIPRSQYDLVVYDNNKIEIVILEKEMS